MTRAVPQTEHTSDDGVLYVAFELSNTRWKVAMGDGGKRVSEYTFQAGDVEGVVAKVQAVKRQRGLEAKARVVSCYEAGRDGFWLHRAMESRGIENVVVDPSSIEVNRRSRRAKTDRLDVNKLLMLLKRYDGGVRDVWSVVRVPTVDQEDARRPHRERIRLKKERAAHSNRIRSLLVLHGVRWPVGRKPPPMQELVLPDGRPLPVHLKTEIAREWARWELVDAQIKALDAERQQHVKDAVPTETPSKTVAFDHAAAQVRRLTQLVGIGPTSAWILSGELFAWRTFRNRRELAAAAGLTPTPFASGETGREQGISKAGNRRVRAVLVEIAWAWLRFQPRSRLATWFHERFGQGTGRQRRVGIVAVARRLLVDLWRFLEHGVVPEGVRLT